ncbi:hypothetical protein F0562_011547 [Nyssa sinensis]|uniref:WRKY domain-containing protein n=1 Tax=Nyssa sinensis TaxID=561372 RepID=A0A5J4ZSP7_9ASTE|nr:hypothetical protein F0562_011547 [Nyssa sinensis]
MSDFAGMSDWDLQAVVRGCTNDFSNITTSMDNSPTCFSPFTIQEDGFLFSASPDYMFETTTVLDELEQLYKPFYPVMNPLSPQNVLSDHSREEREPENVVQDKQLLASSTLVASANTAQAAKYKRRKNQQKKVLHVTAEGLSSDMWAWRKYGQKPIKGSPYPRSYYRCSSSKGCLARKQVERSHSDPDTFIITYTAEHSHSQPTRRNSLAGTTRHKFSTPKNLTTASPDMPAAKDSSNCSDPISTAALSPTTPSSATSNEDEFVQEAIKKESGEEDGEYMVKDMILSDDFFAGLDEFDGLTTDPAFDHAFLDQFSVTFPC